MIVPYNVDVPMERWPIANWALIGFTCVMSIAVLGNAREDWVGAWMVLQRGEDFSVWQLGGALVTHGGFLHLVGNMFFLFVFGNAVNARLGHALYLATYLAVGVLSNLAWLVLSDGPAVIGASGAIMGIIGAFLVLYPRNDVSIFYWIGFAFTGTFEVSAYWVVAAYFGFDLWGLARSGDASSVAYLCHVSGAIFGFGVLSVLLATGLVKPGEGEQTFFQALRGGSRRSKKGIARMTGPVLRPPPGPRAQDSGAIPLSDGPPARVRQGPPPPRRP